MRLLGELMTLEYGSGLRSEARTGEGFPVLGSSGIVGRHSHYQVQGPGIVIGRKGTVGAVSWSSQAFWPIDTTYYVVAKEPLDLRWCYWLLTTLPLKRLDSSTGVPGLNRNDVYRIAVDVPPLPEQHRIAKILDTIDEAIQATEALIAKLRQARAGLLHDLLTRGIDEHGHLRDPDAHPEQFKDSPLGRIPNEWTLSTLGVVGTWLSGGTPSKAEPTFWSGPIPWVTPKDMKTLRLRATEDSVTQVGAASGSRVAPSGTIFIVVRGMILAHTFPVSVADQPMAFNQDVKGLAPHDDVASAYLAHWFVSNEESLLGIVTEATHGTKRIDMHDLQSRLIALPPRAEQERIDSVIRNIDDDYETEMNYLAKLKLLKQGVMSDLLSGRVLAMRMEDFHVG